MGLNTTAATIVPGQLGSAALWNVEVRDAINGIQSAWTSYTPALTTTGTAVTLGTGSSATGGYLQVGKSITGYAEIVWGSAGVAVGTGNYNVSLPVAAVASASSAGRIVGQGVIFDASAAAAAAWFQLSLVVISATTVRGVIQGFAPQSASSPVVPAVNDQIRIQFQYEAA